MFWTLFFAIDVNSYTAKKLNYKFDVENSSIRAIFAP